MPHMSASKQHIRDAFEPLTGDHRMQLIAEKDGIRYVDNSSATSVNGAWYGLESIHGKSCVHWLVGCADSPGLADAWRAILPIAREKVKVVYDIGVPTSAALRFALAGHFELHGTPYLSLAHAVWTARAAAEPGDVVLLNPGGHGMDVFATPHERGQAFSMAVALI